MFEITEHGYRKPIYTIQDNENGNYLHSDGNWFKLCPEWWPTRELAQVVLDKYQSETEKTCKDCEYYKFSVHRWET